jgi:CBS domain-containing protein
MRAKDIMTRNVLTVRPDAKVQDIAKLFVEKHISGLPVVDAAGKLLGIVSEGDLMRRSETGTIGRRSWWLEVFASREDLAQTFVKMHAQSARDVMSSPAVTVEADTPLADVAKLLEQRRIKRVPVLFQGKLVGIISRANLMQALVAAGGVAAAKIAPSDEKIREQLLAKLAKETWADTSLKNIFVTNGVVHLWGIADSEEERRAMRIAAEEIPGVKGVEDHLTKRLPGAYV